MRKVLVSLHSNDKSIEYQMDLEALTFESSLISANGDRNVVQSGDIGQTDAEKQDLALRMYHILLAALRPPKYE